MANLSSSKGFECPQARSFFDFCQLSPNENVEADGTSNNYTAGGGAGFGIILPATKKLDVILEGLAGNGIGRYASGLGPDVTLRPDASIVPLRTLQTMAGLEW